MSAFLEALGITILVDAIKQFVLAFPKAIQNWRFKRFFGKDSLSGDRIYGVLDPVSHPLPPGGNRYIKRFLGRKEDTPLIGPNYALGLCSVRVVTYGSALFARFRPSSKPLIFEIDYNVENKWDASFICFGSADSNLKTFDIQHFPQQKYFEMTFNSSGMRTFNVGNKKFDCTANYDHGILLRMKNPRHPEHTLFVCAGLGEWGTSGAAYYLFHNWSKILWKHGKKDFCKVIKVENKSDESATVVFSIP